MAQHVENLAPAGARTVVTVSKSLGERRGRIAGLVAWAVDDVLGDAAGMVHVKVKRAGPARGWGVEMDGELVRFASRSAAIRRARSHGIGQIVELRGPVPEGVRAWAYDGVPYSSHPGRKYLITVRLGRPRRRYPTELRYRVRVPMTVRSHEEEIVVAAAHEARHTHQFINGLPRSEVDCDRIAVAALQRHRRVESQSA